MKPLKNQIIIKPYPQEEKSRGGILLPENSREKPCRGIVLYVGEGEYQNGVLIPCKVKPNDVVMYPKWAGSYNEFEYEGKELASIKETDIICILGEE